MKTQISKNIFICWFSSFGNDMTENRKKSLDIISNSCGVGVTIIDNCSFYQYEDSQLPIHPAFKLLSDVHKSDYARAYLMYFYGGGYSDLKPNSFDWNPYFDKLFSSSCSVIGYREVSAEDIASFRKSSKTKRYIQNNFSNFIGNGHYIFKPKTEIAYLWLQEIHNILDNKLLELMQQPGHIGYSKIKGYPIDWSEICGRIFHKLQYKSTFKNILYGMPFPIIENYR